MTWAMMTTESATGHWARLLFNEVLLRGAKITNERKHSWFNEDNKDIMSLRSSCLWVFAERACDRLALNFYLDANGMLKTDQFDIIRVRGLKTIESNSANF